MHEPDGVSIKTTLGGFGAIAIDTALGLGGSTSMAMTLTGLVLGFGVGSASALAPTD